MKSVITLNYTYNAAYSHLTACIWYGVYSCERGKTGEEEEQNSARDVSNEFNYLILNNNNLEYK